MAKVEVVRLDVQPQGTVPVASDVKLEVDYLIPTQVSTEGLVLEVEYIGNVVTSRVEFSLGRAEATAVTKHDDGCLVCFKLFSPFVQILEPPNHSLSGDGILQLRLLSKSDNELHMMGCITQISADEGDRLYRTIISPL
mmetsp:Transcript_3383/g.21139  ORF Transcript_3383/g.21139 Transcript_3383/m.21139 type:complete len:139 (+) Transcript_3383:1774-2190(+)